MTDLKKRLENHYIGVLNWDVYSKPVSKPLADSQQKKSFFGKKGKAAKFLLGLALVMSSISSALYVNASLKNNKENIRDFPQYEIDTDVVLEKGTYLVKENVFIKNTGSLDIAPGSVLKFDETFISATGKLIAKGLPEDSIVFEQYRNKTWQGLLFQSSSSDSSILEYCRVSGVDSDGSLSAAITFHYSSATITRSSILENLISKGAIFVRGGSPTITESLISRNLSDNDGAGIFIGEIYEGKPRENAPVITRNTISHNYAHGYGSAIFGLFPSGQIEENIINNNYCCGVGNVLFRQNASNYHSDLVFKNNVISDNRSKTQFKGLALEFVDLDYSGNVIDRVDKVSRGRQEFDIKMDEKDFETKKVKPTYKVPVYNGDK